MSYKIHIFGASGSGTTSLGIEISRTLGIQHLDADSYYWKSTEPPFSVKNTPEDRIIMIREAIKESSGWVLSGSICSWGDQLVPEFTLAVFLALDPNVRIKRLRQRELHRYGSRIESNGDLHERYLQFMDWASSYDSGGINIRSKVLHQKWMKKLECPVIELNSERPIKDLASEVVRAAA